MSTSTNDFDIAKSIADLLKGLEDDRKHRVLRWVAESLGIEATSARSQAITAVVTSPLPTTTSIDSPLQKQATNIKSFVELKSPKSDVQFAAVVAYYYRFEASADERSDAISAEVLQDAARLASWSRFKKPAMTLNNAKNQGYLDVADRGRFAINSVGENLVAMTLPGQLNNKPKAQKRSAPKKKSQQKRTSKR